MGHYYDCRHCGQEDHNHTCPGKEAELRTLARKYYAGLNDLGKLEYRRTHGGPPE